MLEEKNDNLPEADGQEQTNHEETVPTTNQSAIEAIENTNAEESEDDAISEGHDIPMLNYEAMSMEELVAELDKLVANQKVMSIRNHVEEIRKDFMDKYHHCTFYHRK